MRRTRGAKQGSRWPRGMATGRSIGCITQRDMGTTHLLLRTTSSLDAVPALDHVGLEADWARTTVQFQEEAARIAQNRSHLVATP